MQNNQEELIDRFENIKSGIDHSLKNIESKVAELISDKKKYNELKNDIENLKLIINNVDENLLEFKKMLK